MEIVNYNQQNCDFRFDPACYVPCVSLETWREDYDHRACTYLAKAATLKKTKLYQKMQANNMAYSRISLNHMQQKTDLLTIAVIRKRRRWTANMAIYTTPKEITAIHFVSTLYHRPSKKDKRKCGHVARKLSSFCCEQVTIS